MGTAWSIHKAGFPFGKIASHPLADGIAGDGELPGCLPEAATLLPGLDDLEAQGHFALLMGELVSFGECKGQKERVPPFFKV